MSRARDGCVALGALQHGLDLEHRELPVVSHAVGQAHDLERLRVLFGLGGIG